MNEFSIAGRKIGDGYPPYIVAEISANHNGNVENAIALIRQAKQAGADAVKIQTYRADTLTINSDKDDFKIKDGLWEGRTLYELYEWAHTPWEWHETLFKEASAVGIPLFSSPFDETAVDLLEQLNTPAYKIASFELVDLALIRRVARTGKPLIMSTGMANREEIGNALAVAKENGAREIILMHCVSGYPAPAKDYNLATIPDMINEFDCLVGLSDHTIENSTAIASVAFGACAIEKHFTLDREGGGPDDSFSLELADLTALCRESRLVWDAIGSVNYTRKASEKSNLKFRRSLYVVESIKKGEILTCENVRSIRPGFGLDPKHYDDVIGSVVSTDIEAGTRLAWELIDSKRAAGEE